MLIDWWVCRSKEGKRCPTSWWREQVRYVQDPCLLCRDTSMYAHSIWFALLCVLMLYDRSLCWAWLIFISAHAQDSCKRSCVQFTGFVCLAVNLLIVFVGVWFERKLIWPAIFAASIIPPLSLHRLRRMRRAVTSGPPTVILAVCQLR